MSVLASSLKMAQKQIAAFGEPCTWESSGVRSVPDPSKPWLAVEAARANHAVSILFKVNTSDPLMKLVQGSDIEAGGVKALLAAVDFIPSLADIVIRADGTKLALQSITPLYIAGQIILYYLAFKK